MKEIDIYTDGACSGNPGVGGWAAILIYGDYKKEICGYFSDTTNNRMELFSILQAFKTLKQKCKVNVFSDSSYVVNSFNQNYIKSWQANGWKTASKSDVKNSDIWKALLIEVKKHDTTFIKVKGHSDNAHNNRCDELARQQIEICKAGQLKNSD